MYHVQHAPLGNEEPPMGTDYLLSSPFQALGKEGAQSGMDVWTLLLRCRQYCVHPTLSRHGAAIDEAQLGAQSNGKAEAWRKAKAKELLNPLEKKHYLGLLREDGWGKEDMCCGCKVRRHKESVVSKLYIDFKDFSCPLQYHY